MVAPRSAQVASPCQLDFWHINATSSRQNSLRVRAMDARVDCSGPRITSKHHVGTKPSSKQAKGALQGSVGGLIRTVYPQHATMSPNWRRHYSELAQTTTEGVRGAGNFVGSKPAPVERRDSGRLLCAHVGAPAGLLDTCERRRYTTVRKAGVGRREPETSFVHGCWRAPPYGHYTVPGTRCRARACITWGLARKSSLITKQ